MKVLFAGESRDIKNSPWHAHDCCEIIITVNGEGKTRTSSGDTPVYEGTITVMPPNFSHSHMSETSFSDIFIHVDGFEMPVFSPMFCMDETGAVMQLGKMLYTVYIQKERNYKAIADSLLGAVYEYIVKLSESGSKYEFVQKFKDILALRLSDPGLDINREASKMGVSFDYMRHCFKEETGQTPLEYLTKMRIRQAKRHLRQNNFYSIGEIAYLCGFSDRYYFSRCFKKHIGVSPKEYRENRTNF